MIRKIAGKIKISINLGISSAFIFLILFTAFTLCIFVFISVKQMLRSDLEKQIRNIVAVGALQIDGDLHNSLLSSSQENSGTYKSIKSILMRIRENVPEVRYVYTMRMDSNGEYIFVVDADDNPNDASHIGDIYDSPSPAMKQAFSNKGDVCIETGFSKDKWGEWISGFAPIMTHDGKFAGIMGVDMSAARVTEYERKCLLVIFFICLSVGFLVVFLGIIVSRRIAKPLKLLETDLGRIQRLEFGSDEPIATIFKEIHSMDLTVENMKSSLRSFKKYVPAALVNQLMLLGKEAKISGDKKELTMFFSDIADFTRISEIIKPEELVSILERYFDGMTRIIHEYKGTVDKFIGDSVMAFWGAPCDLADHALPACRAAIKCHEFSNTFNIEMVNEGYPQFATRIGISTGSVIVGNIGHENRLNYTVIGDNVNLASRLEGLNKYYNTGVLISGCTYELVKDKLTARKIDNVIVKGKENRILIYELLGETDSMDSKELEFARLFNLGTDYYFGRNWSEALSCFKDVLMIKPGDKPSVTMLKRCMEFIDAPPPEDWTGAVIMADK